jgi:hypothetical protein
MLNLFGGSDQGALRRIEAKLDLILAHLGLEFRPLSEEVRRAAEAGEKITAIKLYRQATGAGLAEAKQAVEECLRQRG